MGEPTPEPGALTVQRRLVAWDPTTQAPTVKTVPMIPKSEIHNLAQAALSLPYHDPIGLEPEFAGMTNAEVMVIKLSREAARTGDSSLIETLLDRVLGKPKQSAEVLQVRANYEDYLKELAAKHPAPIPAAAEPAPPGEVIDVMDEEIFG